jgi:hypothetical protein
VFMCFENSVRNDGSEMYCVVLIITCTVGNTNEVLNTSTATVIITRRHSEADSASARIETWYYTRTGKHWLPQWLCVKNAAPLPSIQTVEAGVRTRITAWPVG